MTSIRRPIHSFLTLPLPLIAGLLACGGNAQKDPDDGSAGNGSGGNGSGASGAGADGAGASTSTGGSGGDGTAGNGLGGTGGEPGGCDSVPGYIQNLYEAAASCAAADPVPHCQDIVDGFCCPVVVESIQSPQTQAYLDFLELTKTQCPDLWDECALVDCAFPIGGTCVPSANGMGGICEPSY